MVNFYDIKRKVTRTAKDAIKKSNELVDVTRLNISIGEVQSQRDELLKELGKIIYDAYKSGDIFSDELDERCRKIDDKSEQIREIKDKISKLKNIRSCPECEKENDIKARYCSKCGLNLMEDDLEQE